MVSPACNASLQYVYWSVAVLQTSDASAPDSMYQPEAEAKEEKVTPGPTPGQKVTDQQVRGIELLRTCMIGDARTNELTLLCMSTCRGKFQDLAMLRRPL